MSGLGRRARALLAAAGLAALAGSPLLLPGHALAATPAPSPSTVATQFEPDGHWAYLVNGHEQLFVGIGYNPIYRNQTLVQRTSSYQRDFHIMCQAGVNTITGWDQDKGFVQDTFDETTLNTANQYGIGVVMPFYLPPTGDYTDDNFVNALIAAATSKVQRYKDNPALRMWGLGNEVLSDMADQDMHWPFLQAYLKIADAMHAADPNHPVIYREAEDGWLPMISDALTQSGDMRPWLLYGMNEYEPDIQPFLDRWPSYQLDKPLIISEFGPDGVSPQDRATGYADMWAAIRSYPDFVLGGAPYAWTTEGPEPTDKKWGLMDGSAHPVDRAFQLLAQLWKPEPLSNKANCG